MFSSGRFTIKCIHTISKRYAGHSKWQNIRHVKAAKDTEKSQLFVKLGARIKIAIQESGNSDPVYNSKLSQAIDVAKSKNMPINTIQSYINQGKKTCENSKIMWYELKGPKGTFFILQVSTDNPKRTRDTITSVIKKCKYSLVFSNNLRNQFIHKGIIFAVPKGEFSNAEEVSVEHAIESGAEDVQPEDNRLRFICDPVHVKKVADKLQQLGYEIEDADDQYLPINSVEVDDDHIDSLSKAVDKLYALPEILKIYDNIS